MNIWDKNQVAVGTMVAIEHDGRQTLLYRVQRLTSTQAVLGNSKLRLRLADGLVIGTGQMWHQQYAWLPSKQEIKHLLNERRQHTLANVLRMQVVWSRVPLPQLEAIHRILKKGGTIP